MKKEEIKTTDIEYLAGLSGLEFDDAGLEAMRGEVEGILTMLNGCASVDGEESQDRRVVGLGDLRDDEVISGLAIDAVFQDKICKGSSFVVPSVVQ